MKVLSSLVVFIFVSGLLLSFQNCNGGAMGVDLASLQENELNKSGFSTTDVLLEQKHWGWYGLAGPDYAIAHKISILRNGDVLSTDVYDRASNAEVSKKIATLDSSVIAKLGRVIAQLDVTRTKELRIEGAVMCDGGSYEYSATRDDGVHYAFAGYHDCGGEWIKGNGTDAAPEVQYQIYQLRDILKGVAALNIYVAE